MNVLITGSSKGLGRSLALVFADNKWNVILHGRNKKRLAEVRSEVTTRGATCTVVVGDITSEQTRNSLYKAAKENGLDVLINNAGIYANKPFQDMDSKEFRRIIEVNLIAPVYLIQKLCPTFIKQGSGAIININSIAGKNPSELESAYCASKYGLRGFTEAFQIEANKHNVRAINVYCGAINTTMTMRKDSDKFIGPIDAAETIYGLCKDYPTMMVSEIEIHRRANNVKKPGRDSIRIGKSTKGRKKESGAGIRCPKCKESTNDYGVYYPPKRIYCTNCGETIILTDRTRKRYLENKSQKGRA